MSSDQMVCVKRPEPGLSELFEEMYVNERLVDCTLSCSDGQIQAHKLVLAACSPYFGNLFGKLSNPFQYPFIVIKDMQIDDLKMIVDYMYRGQLIVSQDRLASLVKSAENLQITGLSSFDKMISSPADASTINSHAKHSINQRFKRTKRAYSSTSSNHNQTVYSRAYQQYRMLETDDASSPRPDKLLEQTMIIGESSDGSSSHNQLNYPGGDPTSTRNLNNSQHLSTPANLTQIPNLGVEQQQQQQQQHHQQQQQQQQHLNNQLQVLSHSLSANRTSLSNTSTNGHSSNQLSTQQQTRGRVHPCNICWKTFREKANLKRHLQVHSLDRIIYACPDCNKTFSWKDNYIRHTKTAHHMNNVRSQP